MYLEPCDNNHSNSDVMNVQRMLNIIRLNFHHNWQYLTEDGIYGKQTSNAVRQFQYYKGISSQMTKDGPVLGDTTIQYIKEEYGYVPQISSVSSSNQLYHPAKKKNPLEIAKDITDQIMGFIQTFDDFIKREISYVQSLRTTNPNALKQRFYAFATKMDPSMRKLKAYLSGYNDKNSLLPQTYYKKNAKLTGQDLVRELRKFDIVTKIERFLESKGFSGKIELGKHNSKTTIKIKGGGILSIWSYKDLIVDLCKFTEWGSEKWNADVKKHFYEILDGLIIGYASTVIAELIVGITIAAVGATISVGWIVVIIAIAALLLSLLFSFLMSEANVSFSQKAFDGYGEIISLVKF